MPPIAVLQLVIWYSGVILLGVILIASLLVVLFRARAAANSHGRPVFYMNSPTRNKPPTIHLPAYRPQLASTYG